ncbi:MAG TPA: hypothetical protein VGH58_03445, partial [Solirubrobacterales bacterium]
AGLGDHPGTAIEQLIGVFLLSWHGLGVPFFQVGILVSRSPSNPVRLTRSTMPRAMPYHLALPSMMLVANPRGTSTIVRIHSQCAPLKQKETENGRRGH